MCPILTIQHTSSKHLDANYINIIKWRHHQMCTYFGMAAMLTTCIQKKPFFLYVHFLRKYLKLCHLKKNLYCHCVA